MNTKLISSGRMGLTMTTMSLCAVMVASLGCASDSNTSSKDNGGSSGNGSGSSGNSGSSGGSTASTTTSGGGTSSGNCPAPPSGSNEVNFCNGKAQGAMEGYAYISLGPRNSASTPVCAEDPSDLTKTRLITAPPIGECEAEGKTCPRTGQTVWNAPDKLCISGKLPKVEGTDYASAWGLQIGVNTGDPPASDGGKTLGDIISDASSLKTIAVTVPDMKPKVPDMKPKVQPTNNAIRIVIHLKDMECTANPYCATILDSDKPVALTAFNTECWAGSTCGGSTTCKQLTESDIPKIDKIGVQISSDTAQEYDVTDFCLQKITFGK